MKKSRNGFGKKKLSYTEDLLVRINKALNGHPVSFEGDEIAQVAINWEILSQVADNPQDKAGFKQNADYIWMAYKMSNTWIQPGYRFDNTYPLGLVGTVLMNPDGSLQTSL